MAKTPSSKQWLKERFDDIRVRKAQEGGYRSRAACKLLEIQQKDRLLKLVMPDMAPNISGMNDIDQPRAMYLIELAVDFAEKTPRPGGSLWMKVFQGEGFTELLHDLKGKFAVVVNRKPDASRSRSRELYVLAKELRG